AEGCRTVVRQPCESERTQSERVQRRFTELETTARVPLVHLHTIWLQARQEERSDYVTPLKDWRHSAGLSPRGSRRCGTERGSRQTGTDRRMVRVRRRQVISATSECSGGISRSSQ